MNFDSRRILGVVVLITGLAILGFLFYFGMNDFTIWFFGEDVNALITDTRYVETSPEGSTEKTFEYFIEYSFENEDGRIVVGESRVPGTEWSGASIGNRILINYSRLNPENNRIDDSQYRSLLKCSYLPVLVICIFALVNGWRMLDGRSRKKDGKELFNL